MNLPGEQIDPGQQAVGAMAFVLMITREGRVDAGYRRQIGGLGAIEDFPSVNTNLTICIGKTRSAFP
jgi:hypothetical protein